MNEPTYSGLLFRLFYRLMLKSWRVGAKRKCNSFGDQHDQRTGVIRQVYVINLDRQTARWNLMRGELQRMSAGSNKPLAEITQRFSALDARDNLELPIGELQTSYSLADQLFVEPNPLLEEDEIARNQRVGMTRQEIAVALSHIALWKLIASSEHAYTLVLEDDVYFRPGFAQMLDKAWAQLTKAPGPLGAFDLLYLSYKEAKTKVAKRAVSDVLFRPLHGLWQLSGYVLSKKGAAKLLGLLPVRGPVDLWINHQFHQLNVFATHKPIVRQRLDCRSDNLYSILPVLSRVGVLTHEKPLLFEKRQMPKPVFAVGRQGTGLTSLSMALSMLGYRCCSDISALPQLEHNNLFSNSARRVFDAYVNVGSLSGQRCLELAKLYPGARFIIAVGDEEELIELNQTLSTDEMGMAVLLRQLKDVRASVLVLPIEKQNTWSWLCRFLECEYPTNQYPTLEERGQRNLSTVSTETKRSGFRELRRLRHDESPWITPSRREWQGVPLAETSIGLLRDGGPITLSERFQTFDTASWMLRDDTFPSNLALFRPSNFAIASDNCATLTLCKESSKVRQYTSASICSRQHYLYGRFAAAIRPAKAPGLITGIFLHRNSPRQEIDIEFLGKDTTKLLVNVYYNPGGEGANLEFGYRGTPVLIDLGFDAANECHEYAIEWSSTSIRWLVDSRLAYERANWDPTPIPHLPMQFYVNLWHSRSDELAGRLHDGDLPAHTQIESIDITALAHD